VIDDLSDPRLEPYRNLKNTNLTRWSGIFIAEGRFVVERLIESDYEVISILVSDRKRRLFPEPYDSETDLLVVPHEEVESLLGYKFHQGVMACGRRKPEQKLLPPTPGKNSTLIACPHTTDPDNVGTIIRLARAFGVEGMLFSDRSTDPFARRVLRVSMGNAFYVPMVVTDDLEQELIRLQQEQHYELVATVLDDSAEPLMSQQRSARTVLLFGNEATGLTEDWVELCDRQVTLPMDGNTDSLNVAMSAGIFLYHYTRLAQSG